MIYVALLALLAIGGGGFYWYEKFGPGAQAAAAALPPRSITLDTNLPDADKQAVIAAIMSAVATPAGINQLTALATHYSAYPWTNYELMYRAWELSGSTGSPPPQPAAGGGPPTPMPAPAQPPAGQPVAQPTVGPTQPQTPIVAPSPVVTPTPAGPGAPSAGPFDLSHATVSGAWQTDAAFIKAYQGALTYLAFKYNQPTWDPQGTDGKFGPHTQAAVKAFQTAKGLSPVDGKVGKGTATAIAAALTATQTSGQGGYAAFPGEGDGPGDTRYGAHPNLGYRGYGQMNAAAGLGEDSVQGLGEDSVQGLAASAVHAAGVKKSQTTRGLGEDSVQGLGEDSVQGLGEDEVQGTAASVAKAQATRSAEDQVGQVGAVRHGLGQTAYARVNAADVVEGLGEDSVQGRQQVGFGQRQIELSGAAVVAAQQALATAPRARPMGGWHLLVRPTDKVWPRKVAEIGTGMARGTPGAMQHLTDINPHLSPGGVMRQFVAGDEVNVPASWANALRAKGFDVRPDASLGEIT